jgi:hypothetical protein
VLSERLGSWKNALYAPCQRLNHLLQAVTMATIYELNHTDRSIPFAGVQRCLPHGLPRNERILKSISPKFGNVPTGQYS